jgi:hypothetical protein
MRIDLFDDNVKNDSGFIPLNPEYLSTKTEQPKEENPIAEIQKTEISKELPDSKHPLFLEALLEKEDKTSTDPLKNYDYFLPEIQENPTDKIFSNYEKFDQEQIKYWKDLYGWQPELIERVVIDRMLIAENLEKNPVNTTKCLNKLFKAQYAGYVENPYYDRHAYTFNFYDYNYA